MVRQSLIGGLLALSPLLARAVTPPTAASAPAASAGAAPVFTIYPDRIGGSPAISTDGRPLGPPAQSPSLGTVPTTRPSYDNGNSLPIEGQIRRLPWNRLAFGGYAEVGNLGVLGSWFQLSQDSVLRGTAIESGYGFGLLVDFPTPADEAAGLRLQVGARLHAIAGTEAILAADPTADLESSATILAFSLLYRYGLPHAFPGLWVGAGAGLDYAFSTERNGQVGTKNVSHIANTYGFTGILAAGVDIPISPLHDVVTQFTWRPFLGYALTLGARIEM